jgi:hypothetical protein
LKCEHSPIEIIFSIDKFLRSDIFSAPVNEI